MKRSIVSAVSAASVALLTACGGATLPGASTFAQPSSASAPSSTPSSTPSGSTSTSSSTSSGTTGSTSGTTSGSTATSGSGTTFGSGTTTPPASSSPLPTPPSTATVFTSVQDTTDNWSSCSACAGGSSTAGTFWSAPFQTSPSLSGSSRQFYVSGPAWSSVLWYKKFGAQDSASHFLWDFWVYFNDTSAAQTWSAEYDLWQSMGGQEFMIGSQCDFGDGEWDLWDSLHGTWIKDSGVPCPRFAANSWHHIQWYLERVSSTQYKYVTLVVDDKPYSLNRTFTANPTNWGDNFGVQWQLDESSTGTALNEWVDKVTVSIW